MNAHLAIETFEEPHQPFDTVVGKLAAFKPGNFRLLNFQNPRGLCLSQLAVFENPKNLRTKLGFEQLFFRFLVTKAPVRKDVVTALFDFNLLSRPSCLQCRVIRCSRLPTLCL